MDYNEAAVLLTYLEAFCPQLLTELELRVCRALRGRVKAAQADRSNQPDLARLLLKRWGCPDEEDVNAALREGAEAFERRVWERVLADPAAQRFINRCPQCRRLVRSPTARQCFWCGHDWHGQ